jgi:hypothetical protein
VRTGNLTFPAFLWVYAAFKIMHFWPPTLAQSEILVGTILAYFLFGWIHSRLGSITFDSASRDFMFERSVLSNALNALFAGAVVGLLALFTRRHFRGMRLIRRGGCLDNSKRPGSMAAGGARRRGMTLPTKKLQTNGDFWGSFRFSRKRDFAPPNLPFECPTDKMNSALQRSITG